MRPTVLAALFPLLAALAAPPPAVAADGQQLLVPEIERIVKEYLLREPVAILGLAARHGYDRAALAREMEAPWVTAHVEETRALADKLGFSATPIFVIGDTLIPGAVPVAELAAKVAEERGRAN